MRKLFSILFFGIFLIVLEAQTGYPQKPALPADIAKWNGRTSDRILQNPVIQKRLKTLMGERNYADFMESWETVNPFIKKGNFLFSNGCLIHACGHVESAIAIDLVNRTVHAAIFRETEKTRFFNDRRRKTPSVIAKWASRLEKK